VISKDGRKLNLPVLEIELSMPKWVFIYIIDVTPIILK
jgi:hypothetical protein